MEKISVKDDFLPNIVFSNEATFRLSGTLYDRSVQMWRFRNPPRNERHS
jgi:hypothetical protein